jgi:signal transduction histidine kinase
MGWITAYGGRIRPVQPVDSSTARVAAGLDLRRAELMTAYHDLLQRMDSPLLDESTTLVQVIAHAMETLDEVITCLREDTMEARGTVLAGTIGVSRAASGVHPAESLQAATAAFNVFMTAAAESLNVPADGALLSVAIVINQIIMSRIELAISTYYDFLNDKIYCAHIEERHRLARELHDRVGTEVSVAHRQLELYGMSRASDPGAGQNAGQNNVGSAQMALVQAMDNIRQLALDLRLSGVSGSLDKTLRDYLRLENAQEVATEVLVTGDEDWMLPSVRDEVALVVREALRNALNHGGPRTVVARISIVPHEVRAVVSDDGTGFVLEAAAGVGSGLVSMRERVALLGGVFRVSSRIGDGTTVEFRVPLGQAQDDH